MTIQKGKRYKLKPTAWGLDREVVVKAVDDKNVSIQSGGITTIIRIDVFKELYEEIKDDNQKPVA